MLKLTPKRRVLYVRRLAPVALALFGVFSLLILNIRSPKMAYATAASTVNFQARLQTNSGGVVPDGFYNVEFKLYNVATSGTALWTEDYTDTSGPGSTDVRIQVSDGYLSTALGSINPFPSTIDWSQQLYLTMNIGGTGTSASWDGEMSPRLALTATPYAFLAQRAVQADELSTINGSNTSTLSLQGSTHGNQTFVLQDQGSTGTYHLLTSEAASNSFIQLQTGTPSQQTGQIDISGAATVGSVVTSSVDSVSSGTLALGGINATTVSVGNTNSATQTTLQGGTGSSALQLQVGSGGTIGIGSNGVAETIQIGQSGSTTVVQNINIGNATSASATNVVLGDHTAGTTSIQGAGGITLADNTQISSGASFTVSGGTTTLNASSSGNSYGLKVTTGGTTTNNGVIIQGTSGQAGDLLQVQDSTGASMDRIDASGNIESTGSFNNATGGIGKYQNLLLYSEQLDNGAWTASNTTVTANNTAAPNGQTAAEKLVSSCSGCGGGIFQTTSTAPTNDSYTFSVWVKSDTGTQNFALGIGGSSSGLSTKSFVATTSWQRFSITQNTNGYTGFIKPLIFPGGTSADGTVYAWGAQLVKDSVPEVYTSTTGVAAGANYGAVTNGGLAVNGTAQLISQTNSADAFAVQNASGNDLLSVDTSAAGVIIGKASTLTGNLQFANASSSFKVTLNAGNSTENYAITLPTDGATGTECLTSTSGSTSTATALQFTSCGSLSINNSTSLQSANMYIQAATGGTVTAKLEAGASSPGDILDLLNNSGVNVATFGATGSVLFKTSTDSTTAFQVQSHGSSTPVLDVDTSNGRVGVNMNNPGYALDVNGVINSNTSVDVNGVAVCTTACIPVAGNGNYIQNGTSVQTAANFFIRSSSTSAPVGILQGASGQTADLLDVQTWNGTSSTTVDKFDSTGGLTINTSSTNALLIQNGGVNLLNADTASGRISVGAIGTATGQLYVGGSIASSVFGTGTSTGGHVSDIKVVGNYAYIITNTSTTQLAVYDVSDPSSPVSVGTVAMTTNFAGNYLSVAGKYAYVSEANGTSGTYQIQVFDISNPHSPTSVGTVSTTSTPLGLYAQGRYLYVANGGSTNQLQVYDISNPTAPVSIAGVSAGSGVQDVFVQGRYAYVTDNSTAGFKVFDISNPASPSNVGTLTSGLGKPYNVYVQGRYAYITNDDTGSTPHQTMQVIDVSNPASPSLTGTSAVLGSTPAGIYVQGRYAYVTTSGGNTFVTLDVSNPASPAVLGTPLGLGSNTPGSLVVQGRYAYITDGGANQFQVVDLGGAYVQQIQVGGVETGTIQVDGDETVAGNLSLAGGLTAGGNTQISGDLGVNGSSTFNYAGTTGNGINVNANGLTTGNGVNIATTSALQTAGSLLNVSNTATLATNGGSVNSQLVNVSRALTANVPGTTPPEAISEAGGAFPKGVTGTGLSSISSVAPAHVGDLMLAEIFFTTAGSTTVTGISSSNTGTWTLIRGLTDGPDNIRQELWEAVATSTSSATVSVTYSATQNHLTDIGIDDLTASGSPTWSVVTSNTKINTSSTNVTFPQLTATANTQTYYGSAAPSQTPVPGTCTSGFTCVTSPSGMMHVYNTNLSNSTAYTPVTGQTPTGVSSSIGAIIEADAPVTGTETVSGPVAEFSNSCSITQGTCTDNSNVLLLNQQYTGATGAVLGIQNSGTGYALQIQNSSSANVFTVDSANGIVNIGTGSTGESTAKILVLDNQTGTGAEPTVVNGGMYYNANLGAFRCGAGGAWQSCGPMVARLTSDFTTNSTSATNVTGLTFSVAASTDYSLTCNLQYTSTNTSTGIRLGLNGPASFTSVVGTATIFTNTGGTTASTTTAFNAADNTSGASSANATGTLYPAQVSATFRNGTNAGTLALRVSASAANNISIKAGSSCQLLPLK